MGNRSLDDFLGDDGAGDRPDEDPAPEPETEAEEDDGPAGGAASGSEGEDADGDREDAGDGGDSEGDGPPVAPGGVEPAAVTYAVGTGECAACGERVRERWRGDAGLVCPACKEW
jgi:hypothetical protein